MLQQLVPESCFLTSSKVSFVRPLLVLELGEALNDGLAEAVTDGLAEVLADALGVAFTTVTFFQISFVPDLTQTYLTLETVLVVETLRQLVPAIVAACEGTQRAEINTAVRRTLEYALNLMS